MPITIQLPNAFEAFIAGVFTFLSPCFLPMIPVYIMYLQGGLTADRAGEEQQNQDEATIRKKVFISGLIRTLGFVLGFSIVFVLLGMTASGIGSFLLKYKSIISRIGGLFIIFFGLTMIGVIRLNFLTKDYRKMRGTSAVGMGMAFAFGWSPCIGPVLATILARTASVTSNIYQGAFLLAIYSLGLAIPFILSYVFLGAFEKKAAALGKHSQVIAKIGGVVMVLFGIVLLFDWMDKITAPLIRLLG